MPFSTERLRLWYREAESTVPPHCQNVVNSEFWFTGGGPVASASKGDSSETGTEGAAMNGGGLPGAGAPAGQ